MAGFMKAVQFMHDLTGAVERRTTLMLALLIGAILLLPVAPSGAQVDRPDRTGPTPAVVPTPTPTPEPTPEPTAEPGLGGVLDEVEDQLGEDDGEDQAEAPAPPAASEAPASESEEPAEVQAEGNEAQEVIAAPEAPAPVDRGDGAAPADGDVAAEGEAPAEGAVAADGIAPPPIETYGVNVVPSLGTAARPLTNPYSGDPMVLAPMVAGQQVKGAPDPAPIDKSALLQVVEPARNVAAASLSVVQPSWYATTMALLVLLAAASYGAVLRRRGEDVPEAIAFTGAVRPRNTGTGRSVRPVDLQRSVRSVRP